MTTRTQFRTRSDEVREREQDAVWILSHAAIFSLLFKRNKQERKRVKQKYFRRLIYEQDRELFLLLIGDKSLENAPTELQIRHQGLMRYAGVIHAEGNRIRKRVMLGRAISRLAREMR